MHGTNLLSLFQASAPAALATPSSHEVCACVSHLYVNSGIIVCFMDECALQALAVCFVVIDSMCVVLLLGCFVALPPYPDC